MKNLSAFILVLLLVLFNACGGGGGNTPATGPSGDFDSDGNINSSDNDDDGDGVDDIADAFPFDPSESSDLDGDGIGDNADSDADGDSVDELTDCNDLDPATIPGGADLPDDDLTDSNCDGLDGNASKGIWVSADEGNNSFAGTLEAPAKTITKALELAALLPLEERQVHVVAGTYAEDLIVENQISLFGGYGLLTSGTRSRNLGSQRANIIGVNGDKKAILTFNGASSAVDFTILLQNSNSYLDGLILDSDQNGFGVILLNAGALVKNSILQEQVPLAPRNVTGLLAAILETSATENRALVVLNNQLIMKGNGGPGSGSDFGILALPEDGAHTSLSLEVSNNILESKGKGEKAVAVGAADNDENPNDDSTTDSRADIALIVKNNSFSMTSDHDFSAGVVGGLLMEDPLGPIPNYYVQSAQIIGNEFIYDGGGTGIGASVGPAREDSVIANNVLSLNTTAAGVIGLASIMSPTDFFYNTLSIDLNGSSSYGLILRSDDTALEFSNYVNQTPGSIANNILNIKSSSSAACGLIGVVELVKATADSHVNNGSPAEFKNNDLNITGDCADKLLYLDTQTVTPPNTKLEVASISNLNNKSGFRPDDPTDFSGNISENPQFANSAGGDFTLDATSPCVDTGWEFEPGWKDITGNLRPQGASVDMGAYER